MPVVERKVVVVEETSYPLLAPGDNHIHYVELELNGTPRPGQKKALGEHAAEMREYGKRMTQSMCGV